jgi:hypothetical protein
MREGADDGIGRVEGDASMKLLVGALAIVTLAACAVPEERRTSNVEAATADGVICTYEVPVGSSIRQRKCTTAEERADQTRQSAHQIVIESPER